MISSHSCNVLMGCRHFYRRRSSATFRYLTTFSSRSGNREIDDAGWYEAVMAWWKDTGKDEPCPGCDDYFEPFDQLDKFLSYYKGQTSKRWGYVWEAWISKGYEKWSAEHAEHRSRAKAKLDALPNGEFLEADYRWLEVGPP